MMLKKAFVRVALAGMLFGSQALAAEYQGSSEYYIADVNTKSMAITFARDLAKRNALEQAGTYIISLSESKNSVLQSDEIKSLTLGFAKLKMGSEQTSFSEPDSDGAIVLRYSAIFEINDNEVRKNLKKYLEDTTEKETLKQKLTLQRNLYEELSKKYEELQNNYKTGLVGQSKANYYTQLQDIKYGLEAVTLAAQALEFKRNGDYTSAGIYYDKAMAAVPQDLLKSNQISWLKEFVLTVACERAEVYREVGQYAQSENLLKDVLNADPRFSLACIELAYLYMYANMETDAVLAANKAVELQPNDASYLARGSVYFKFEKWQEALNDYKQIKNFVPSINAGMGLCCYFLKQHPEAVKFFNKAIDVNAKDYTAYMGMGMAYEQMHDYQKAIDCFTKVISIKNDAYHAYTARGTCRIQLGQYAEAYSDSVLALKGNPNDELAKQLQATAMMKLK